MVDYHRFKVGQFEAIVINLGTRPINLSKLFTGVPDEEIEAVNRQHSDAFTSGLHILYLENGEQRILVDTGEPDGRVEAIAPLPPALQAIGINPGSITHVILTHAHLDHIGGLSNQDGQLNYPNARYAMWKTEWENWTLPEALTPISHRIDLIESESEILPGISAVAAPGHTIGHMALLIQSGDARLLHVADALHQPIQTENPSWCPRFDADPETSRSSRRTLLDRAARDHMLVLAYHFPFPALGYVIEQNGAWKWQPIAVQSTQKDTL